MNPNLYNNSLLPKDTVRQQKDTQATNEYLGIIAPYVNQIISLQQQIKSLQEKVPKKQRIKIIKKDKK